MKMLIRRSAMIVTALLVMVAGPLWGAGVASAAAQADYPWQSTASMVVRTPSGASTGCTAVAWVGMNDYGYLSGYGTLSCNKKLFFLGNQVRLTRGLTTLSESWPTCTNCSYLYGGVSSGVGSPGTQYCTRLTLDIGMTLPNNQLVACTSR